MRSLQDEVVAIAEEIWQRTAAVDVPLTFFEFVHRHGVCLFCPTQCRCGGCGSRFGRPPGRDQCYTPMVSAITTISKDHEAYLGPDEFSIAREKGGIIKPQVPVVIGKVSAGSC